MFTRVCSKRTISILLARRVGGLVDSVGGRVVTRLSSVNAGTTRIFSCLLTLKESNYSPFLALYDSLLDPMSTSAASSSSILESLLNHVALPLRLPGKEESRIDQIEQALTDCLLDASRTLRDLTNTEFGGHWDCIYRALQICKAVNTGGKLNKTSLLTGFRSVERRDPLILHVAEQNAGLLIRRHYERVPQSLPAICMT